MTREEIQQDLRDDKYINSFKARRYIEFLLIECKQLEDQLISQVERLGDAQARVEREHGWAIVWADTAEKLLKDLNKLKRRGKK